MTLNFIPSTSPCDGDSPLPPPFGGGLPSLPFGGGSHSTPSGCGFAASSPPAVSSPPPPSPVGSNPPSFGGSSSPSLAVAPPCLLRRRPLTSGSHPPHRWRFLLVLLPEWWRLASRIPFSGGSPPSLSRWTRFDPPPLSLGGSPSNPCSGSFFF